MSVKTIYKCDKCEKEITSNGQFWNLEVVARDYRYGNSEYVSTRSIRDTRIQVCRPCLEGFGIVAVEKTDEPQAEPPTIEDLICEIVERCVDLS